MDGISEDPHLASALNLFIVPCGVLVRQVTFVDKGMVDFMRNWVLHCRKSGISPIVVGAMDAQALQATREFGTSVPGTTTSNLHCSLSFDVGTITRWFSL